LTVLKGRPQSHSKIGWQFFTDAVIRKISEHRQHVVFMLWGNHAQSKAAFIDAGRHLVLKAAHPSPLARGAFFGCKHFSQANAYLLKHHKEAINWQLPE
jgi:uracil-DNA glycosylase